MHADEAARDNLIERVRTDPEFAQDAVHLTEVLPAELARIVLDKAAKRVMSVMQQAEQGSYAISFTSPALTLATLGLRHPDWTDWTTLVRYLENQSVTASSKRRVCIHLAHNHSHLPANVADELRGKVALIQESKPIDFFDEEIGGSVTYLAAALGLVNDDDVKSHLLEHLLSSSQHRSDAAAMIGHLGVSQLVPAAVGMLRDTDKLVVINAATGLAAYASNHENELRAVALTGIKYAASEDGVCLPLNLATALRRAEPVTGELRTILDELALHKSARVRRTARLSLP